VLLIAAVARAMAPSLHRDQMAVLAEHLIHRLHDYQKQDFTHSKTFKLRWNKLHVERAI
jgi:hypothetical protein